MIQQPSSYFPRTPARMRCAHPNHRFRYSLAHAMRTIVRRVATLLKPDNSLIVITFEPFVTSLPADLVTAAKLRNAQFVTQIVRDEHYPLVHGTGLFPRHEIPPSCQPVTHHPGLLCYLSSRFEPTRSLSPSGERGRVRGSHRAAPMTANLPFDAEEIIRASESGPVLLQDFGLWPRR